MIFIGSDHGGYELKEQVVEYLTSKTSELKNFGVFKGESADYPDIAKDVCLNVLKTDESFGILFCGTGIGICIAANKVNGIRAALINSEYTGQMAKEHNHANVICLGGRVITFDEAKKAIDGYMNAKFLGDRHQARVDKIMELERIDD